MNEGLKPGADWLAYSGEGSKDGVVDSRRGVLFWCLGIFISAGDLTPLLPGLIGDLRRYRE